MPILTNEPLDLLRALGLALGLVLATLLLHNIFFRIAQRALRGTADSLRTHTLVLARGPSRIILLLLVLEFVHSTLTLPPTIEAIWTKVLALAWISVFAWSLLSLGDLFVQWVQRTHDIQSEDNLAARKILTQVRLFRRVFYVIVIVIAMAGALMIFETTKNIGTSVLASAGIAGAVIGFSAQRFLTTIVSGIQIAITQPIRLDDVVVIEGEWGRVEEITLTYVVVHIWDERRLIVPVTHFLDKSIQNWTRNSSSILGSVFIFADYRAPVESIRAELERICQEQAGGLWDKRVCGLQVTGASSATMELRALVSSTNSSRNWDLRCLVRERLISYLRDNHPEALPQTRIAVTGATTCDKDTVHEQTHP